MKRATHSIPVPQRGGFTLFEVMLALAIFVGSMAALTQLIHNGMRGAVHSQLQTEAVLRCQSKLAEVIVGAESFDSASGVPFEDDDTWSWTLEMSETDETDLYLLDLTVDHASSNNIGAVSFRLTRLLRDPQLAIDAADEEAAAAADAEPEAP